MFDGIHLPQPALDLIAAKEMIQTRGWVNEFPDIDGPVCAARAIGNVLIARGYGRKLQSSPPALLFQKAIKSVDIPHWNDKQENVDQVLAAFDVAIALAISESLT